MISLDAYYNGVLAQLGEHLPCTQGVIGSIPIRSTICKIQTAYAVFFLYIKILVSEQRNTVCEKTVEFSQFVDYEERQKGLS